MNNQASSIRKPCHTVRNYCLLTLFVAALPLPVVTEILVIVVMLKMLHALAATHPIPFPPLLGKAALGAITAGFIAAYANQLLAPSFKTIPVAGTVLSAISYPLLASCMALALSQLFIRKVLPANRP